VAIRPAFIQPRPLTGLGAVLGIHISNASELEQVRVSGVTLDSRSVSPGDLYVALPGTKVHGAAFCADAAAAGAVAVLSHRPIPDVTDVPVIVTAAPTAPEEGERLVIPGAEGGELEVPLPLLPHPDRPSVAPKAIPRQRTPALLATLVHLTRRQFIESRNNRNMAYGAAVWWIPAAKEIVDI